MPKLFDTPVYRKNHQYELAEELTGRNREAIYKTMRRKGFTLVEAIKFYMYDYDLYRKNRNWRDSVTLRQDGKS